MRLDFFDYGEEGGVVFVRPVVIVAGVRDLGGSELVALAFEEETWFIDTPAIVLVLIG